MTQQLFPRLRAGVELHRTAAESMIVAPVEMSNWSMVGGAAQCQPFTTDGYVVDFLALMDGVTAVDALIERFVGQFGGGFGPMLARQAVQWSVLRDDLVEWAPDPLPVQRPAQVTGSEKGFYPLHATIEIIETCNFTCAHCYYQSSPFKKGRLTLEQAVLLFQKLASNGVRVVEITGGECTIHPQFREILSAAAETFTLVAVISNGYRIGSDEGLAQFVASFPNTVFQISIDGIGERHDHFRRHRGSFDAAVRAVERLLAAGKMVRVSSSISAESVEQILPLYELGKRLGVARHAFAPVSSIGRGCNVTDPSAGARELVDAINDALGPHAKESAISPLSEMPKTADGVDETRNCGAGWRTVAIDYDGNVRACNFSRDSKKLGNVLEEDYRSIFEQPAQFLFNNAPSPGGADCVGCSYYHYCRGCFVKAFTLSEREYPECPWRRRWFPGMSLSLDPDRGIPRSLEETRSSLPVYTAADSPTRCQGCRACAGA